MRIGFHADDLTGASDVLAQAHRYGLDAALVLDPAGGLPDADVVGVAGHARSLAGPALDAAVRAGLAPLAAAGLDVLLYKVCSTFDSSPTTGSIGRGIELLREVLGLTDPVPVCPAQPDFGRWTAFGTHFARAGDAVFRLDRHPVMSRHPATPMHEADLRRVLAAQLTGTPTVPGLLLPAFGDPVPADQSESAGPPDVRSPSRRPGVVDQGGTPVAVGFATAWATAQRAATEAGSLAFVIDAITDAHLDRVAAQLAVGTGVRPVIGSGGIMAALARRLGDPAAPPPSGYPAVAPSGPVLVVSGLAGPVDPAGVGDRIAAVVAAATGAGHTRDVIVCGGDTSSHALAALGVRELRVVEQFVPVGPVCRTDRQDGGVNAGRDGVRDDSGLAGCRVVLKGGQVGPPDLFARFAGKESA